MSDFPGIFVDPVDDNLQSVMDSKAKAMMDWTYKSARGECAWICSDCGCSFPDGMPDACEHGGQQCTDIIQRDKKNACSGGVTPSSGQSTTHQTPSEMNFQRIKISLGLFFGAIGGSFVLLYLVLVFLGQDIKRWFMENFRGN